MEKQAQKAIIAHIKGNQSKDFNIYKVDDINDPNSNWYQGSLIQKFSIRQNVSEGEVFPTISFETCSVVGFVKINDIVLNDIDLSDGVIICARERCDGHLFAELIIGKGLNKIINGIFVNKFSDCIECFGGIKSVDFSTDTNSGKNKFEIEVVKGFVEYDADYISILESVGCDVSFK